MSLLVHCDRCPDELLQPGGLLLGPPDAEGRCEKLHLCISCWAIIRKQVLGVVMEDD